MKAATLVRFLFGKADAIRDVASDRSALWTGIVLVLLTGIARNYDQSYFLDTPFWLFGPLLFSLFSGSFLYLILIRGFGRSRVEGRSGGQWTSFMAVFWMTAPIAWLYAIPVERFLNPYQAAQANLTLLGVVSVWRVLLMSRAMAVLLQVPIVRTFGWVVFAASLEIVVVVFFGAFFSDAFGRRVMGGMAGMRNAPEEDLLIRAFSGVWTLSWGVLAVTIIALSVFRFRGTVQPLPRLSPGRMPWLFLVLISIAWIGIAVAPQRELSAFTRHAELVEKGDYAGALEFLERHNSSDFPPGRRLEPSPYEYGVWQHLPPTIALMNSNTSPWIREIYLSFLQTTFSHRHTSYDNLTNVAAMISAIEGLPEGREWLLSNQVLVSRNVGRSRNNGMPEILAHSNIVETFRRSGMAETNLNVVEAVRPGN